MDMLHRSPFTSRVTTSTCQQNSRMNHCMQVCYLGVECGLQSTTARPPQWEARFSTGLDEMTGVTARADGAFLSGVVLLAVQVDRVEKMKARKITGSSNDTLAGMATGGSICMGCDDQLQLYTHAAQVERALYTQRKS